MNAPFYLHYILPKRFLAGGLLEDFDRKTSPGAVNTMSHKDYFEKYLREPEGFGRLVESVQTCCDNMRPDMQIQVRMAQISYLSDVNKVASRFIKNGTNQVVVLFEKFPDNSTSAEGSSGHFMIMWHFPETFQNDQKNARNRFFLFDSFGRKRKEDDPMQLYYQKVGMCYQYPDSDTCALWCIYALWHWCLKINPFRDVHPVEYNGNPDILGLDSFAQAHEKQLMRNEHSLYIQLIENSAIFQKNTKPSRPL